jgi:hypothetical protein
MEDLKFNVTKQPGAHAYRLLEQKCTQQRLYGDLMDDLIFEIGVSLIPPSQSRHINYLKNLKQLVRR